MSYMLFVSMINVVINMFMGDYWCLMSNHIHSESFLILCLGPQFFGMTKAQRGYFWNFRTTRCTLVFRELTTFFRKEWIFTGKLRNGIQKWRKMVQMIFRISIFGVFSVPFLFFRGVGFTWVLFIAAVLLLGITPTLRMWQHLCRWATCLDLIVKH